MNAEQALVMHFNISNRWGGLNQWGRVKRKDHHLLQKNLVVTFIDFSSLICYRTHTILDIAWGKDGYEKKLKNSIDVNIFDVLFWCDFQHPERSSASLLNSTTLIIPHKNTLIEIEPHLFLTKTANWGSIVLKVFLVYMYDVILVQPLKILISTAAIN